MASTQPPDGGGGPDHVPGGEQSGDGVLTSDKVGKLIDGFNSLLLDFTILEIILEIILVIIFKNVFFFFFGGGGGVKYSSDT